MDKFQSGKVLFLGEQDGPVERELKTTLTRFFSAQRSVFLAYLARVSYRENPEPGVALCLSGGKENGQLLVGGIGEIFKRRFNAAEHMDILFLSDTHLIEIEQVAKPFYVAPGLERDRS